MDLRELDILYVIAIGKIYLIQKDSKIPAKYADPSLKNSKLALTPLEYQTFICDSSKKTEVQYKSDKETAFGYILTILSLAIDEL